MKTITYQINWLENSRYSASPGHNVAQVNTFTFVLAGSFSLEHAMTFSYTDLAARIRNHFGLEADQTLAVPSAQQQYRNHMSALNGFTALCGKTLEANVGAELGCQFDARLREYLEIIDVAPRTKQDRSSQLKTIHRIYKQALVEKRDAPREPTSLSAALRQAIAKTGLAPKTLARDSGITPSTLRGWLNGGSLNQRGFPSLRRLEAALSLERDTLVKLVDDDKKRPGAPSAIAVPAHRRRMAARTKHGLMLPESALNDAFIDEWQELFAYKTGGAPQLKRHAKGSWRLIPVVTCTSLSRFALRRNMACPSAHILIARLRSFLGVLSGLARADGGMGLADPAQQTLAWLVHPQALVTYIDWLTDQSDGVLHNGQKVFARAIASLVRPDTGYLWQQSALFRDRLPEGFRPGNDEEWRQMCAKSHDYLRQVIRTANGVSRHPAEPIADLLASPQLLKPLLDAIKRIDADAAACPPGSLSEARHKRNALLLALLVSNPLRKRTLAALTWTPDGWGSLRGSSRQGWRINLSPLHLKNGDSLRGRHYDVNVAAWVRPRLEAYLDEYRETLLAGRKCEYLLVGDKNGGIWNGITPTVIKLTRRYIPGSPGFGPHAIRHLVATDWLRRHPGDFLTVAELLNDRLETVLSEYAHLKRDDSFSRYDADICEML